MFSRGLLIFDLLFVLVFRKDDLGKILVPVEKTETPIFYFSKNDLYSRRVFTEYVKQNFERHSGSMNK